jgi:hypothetical protein
MAGAGTNGFRIRGLNGASNRVSVQSSHQQTFMLTRRKFAGLLPKWHEVGQAQNELIVIKCQDGADSAEIELEALGDKVGTLIVDSSRRAARSLRVGRPHVFVLEPGESLIVRSEHMIAADGFRVSK